MNEKELLKKASKAAQADEKLNALLNKIEHGTADFQDMAVYSERLSKLIGSVLADEGADAAAAESIMQEYYRHINAKEAKVQATLDKKADIHIKPQQAKFPAERARQVAHSLEDATVSQEVIERRARNAAANVINSFHDDYIQENAHFRSNAGLQCYVTRRGASKCCAWCASISGRYPTGTEPKDFWKRHDNCTCTIDYENNKVRQVIRGVKRTRKNKNGQTEAYEAWEALKETNYENQKKRLQRIQYKPTVLTPEQARETERKNLQYKGLTNSGGNGTIESETIFKRAVKPNRRIGSEGQKIIDKPTYNRLTKDFLKHGGIIQSDEEAIEHLQKQHAHAEYLPSFNAILVGEEPTISDILEETYHAEQDRLHMFGEYVTQEVRLRREIDAQHYLLSMTDKYKIPSEETALTKKNLEDYEQELKELLKGLS